MSEENAITVYRMILRIMKLNGGYSKELVQRMLEKCNLTSIEGWRIDDIESNGNFHSGCHHILWKDIEDFIKRSNWVAKVVSFEYGCRKIEHTFVAGKTSLHYSFKDMGYEFSVVYNSSDSMLSIYDKTNPMPVYKGIIR